MTKKAANGITLANVGAVLLIIGIEIVVAVPRINESIRGYRLNNAAAEVWEDVNQARVLAIKENRTIRVVFDHTSYKVMGSANDVVLSRNMADDYPEVTVDVKDATQEVVFDRTGTSQSDLKEIEIQGPTGIRRFSILATGAIEKLS